LLALRTVAIAAVIGLAGVSPVHAETGKAVTCQSATIPVALASGQPASYTVSGELCTTEDERVPGATVQLLIHGATNTHAYWDFGRVDGIRYLYARDVAAHGFPTFAVDLLGSGSSSHPPSDQLTAQVEAYVAHQIVQALRNGSIASAQFGKVIIVGHSLGSVVVWVEAITYGDVDGVIVTGAAHAVTPAFVTSNDFYPAIKDPKFANSGLDAGYLTTVPGTRATLFLSSPDVDPAVITADEARKDVVPATELVTGLPIVTSKDTLAIQVPVLTILGNNDFTTCGLSTQGVTFDCASGAVVATQEVQFYSPQARIHACVVPTSGHALSLAVNHELQAADTVAWSSAFVGQVDLGERRDFDSFNNSDRGLPWNDGLPWNCGAPSTDSQ
jgi:pimeloyl-ACP methyl ester carboxylesterase